MSPSLNKVSIIIIIIIICDRLTTTRRPDVKYLFISSLSEYNYTCDTCYSGSATYDFLVIVFITMKQYLANQTNTVSLTVVKNKVR
jgi:hypothetical protein